MNRRGLFFLGLGLLSSAGVAAQSAPPGVSAVQRMFDAWKEPVPPRHLIANLYYVGAIGVSAYLITTPDGHVLLDTGFDDTVPLIEKSVRELGFKPTDIKIILSSHAHIDHVGGHARMKRLTGARIYASAEDARTLESGGAEDFIPLPRETILYSPAKVDQVIADGEKVALGGVTLTANLTPGHTRGATTWTMDAVENGKTYRVVFFSSASINTGTKLIDNPNYPKLVQDFTATFAKLKAMRCDIFFAPHGGQFAMAEKFARQTADPTTNPFIDPSGFTRLVVQAEKNFLQQLEQEKAAAATQPATP
ncbi:MAG TPA: subclass B3 metallo-beta-lactamase [Opitutaceae bacterium]|nr:subclass B3 metallo-beta-lactamase [Opitutaceae bacterium]